MMKPEPLLAEIKEMIGLSRVYLAANGEFSLKGLDDKVAVLCGVIMALPKEEQPEHVAALEILLADLNSLGQGLSAQGAEFFASLKEVKTHRNASVAYKTADSRDNFGKKDAE